VCALPRNHLAIVLTGHHAKRNLHACTHARTIVCPSVLCFARRRFDRLVLRFARGRRRSTGGRSPSAYRMWIRPLLANSYVGVNIDLLLWPLCTPVRMKLNTDSFCCCRLLIFSRNLHANRRVIYAVQVRRAVSRRFVEARLLCRRRAGVLAQCDGRAPVPSAALRQRQRVHVSDCRSHER
jgi:hypothetical protein